MSKPTIKSHYLVASRVGANTNNSDNKEERRQRREGMFSRVVEPSPSPMIFDFAPSFNHPFPFFFFNGKCFNCYYYALFSSHHSYWILHLCNIILLVLRQITLSGPSDMLLYIV
ncbi:hypothetical protein HanRHA438_Chr05g0213861 [Helianthus annuus]|uniref:Uncharacterized protein n=1 Tax=Helianthus annuus TaxID=4232 RepID=A0A9K3IXM6_HELAN|nr:hypothetical protein HanXRQr2_Chr05g0203991 [Helianthus annuus]KAJ0569552.1 hypothetical protein HanHA300_Chr05g0167501 [Helianthus annuus]KAJ0583863.1 hypothetical protein HanHA89_Chr05g0181571 [Helianthus annuus]KAJ0918113.1 hypothetical protein HanRHA438_Chr05g0213861 [Helianthus annuus]KAJ0921878.1 hypothetical protein HanPSC8_Chr05g0196831 [Helianthus annuus]